MAVKTCRFKSNRIQIYAFHLCAETFHRVDCGGDVTQRNIARYIRHDPSNRFWRGVKPFYPAVIAFCQHADLDSLHPSRFFQHMGGCENEIPLLSSAKCTGEDATSELLRLHVGTVADTFYVKRHSWTFDKRWRRRNMANRLGFSRRVAAPT